MNQNSYRVVCVCVCVNIYSISHTIEMTAVAAANTTGSIYRTGFSEYNHNAFAFAFVVFLSKMYRIELSQLQCLRVIFTSYRQYNV